MNDQIKQNETTGVILVATGKKYIKLAMKSARSIRKYNPNMNIHLFADWKEQGFDFEETSFPFTSVEQVKNAHYRSKVDYASQTPYERTLYLDTDTRVATDISQIFNILDRFDIALAHAPERVTRIYKYKTDIPDSYPQFNAGVIVYKNSEKVIKALSEWKSEFHEAKFRSDQITLREILWKSDLRIATLPPEYNLRFLKYIIFWNKKEAKPKILHLHYYRRGIFWLFYPWFISAIILYHKITKTPGKFR